MHQQALLAVAERYLEAACVLTRRRVRQFVVLAPQVNVAADGIKQEESEFSPQLIVRLLPKLDWAALRKTASEMGIAELPETLPAKPAEDEAFLKSVHDLIMDIHVMEGSLVCPNCSRAYPVHNGVPNMLLNDDEI